jgi:hypothetical protein
LSCVSSSTLCSSFANTNSANTLPNCTCSSPYVWNATITQCVLNCTLILNTITGTSNNNFSCTCLTGFTWNGNNLTCQNTSTINCSLI